MSYKKWGNVWLIYGSLRYPFPGVVEMQAFLQKKQQTSVVSSGDTVLSKSTPMRQDEGCKSKDCDHSTPGKSKNLRPTSPTKVGTGTLAGSDVVDLSTCEDVRYDARDGIPGVCYRCDGKEDWTPVKKCQERPIRMMQIQ